MHFANWGSLFHVCIIKEKIVKITVCRQLILELFEYKKNSGASRSAIHSFPNIIKMNQNKVFFLFFKKLVVER